MQVHGAIIPPREVLDALDAVVRSVPVPVPAGHAGHAGDEQRGGLLGRLGRRRAEPEPVDVPVMLEHVAVSEMRLPVTSFGNLTTHDVHQLVGTLTEAAAGWEAPTVWFAGGTALDFPGDWSVWAKVAGDVDALMAAARGVTRSVESLGHFVDRRMFRPMLSVATVTRETTGPFLEELVAALDAFHGEAWTPEISLTKEAFVDGRTAWVPFERIPIGG